MRYSIRQVSEIAGVSARTLRYYDSIGLLKPSYTNDAGYRYYGDAELDVLQQIMFYKERGFKLEQIFNILYNKEFNTLSAMQVHLAALKKEKLYLEGLISTVRKTITSMEGGCRMSAGEKFEAFKRKAVEDNEKLCGSEIREKYGDASVEASNKKMLNMPEEDFNHFEALEKNIQRKLEKAVTGKLNPESEAGREISGLHKEWLCMTWDKYSSAAHKGLVQMYVADERFKKYYDKEVDGCAGFLKSAVEYWIK